MNVLSDFEFLFFFPVTYESDTCPTFKKTWKVVVPLAVISDTMYPIRTFNITNMAAVKTFKLYQLLFY